MLEHSPAARISADGERRLSIQTMRGDVILVNTRLWWHQTVIAPQEEPGGLSVSYARDFYLPGNPGANHVAAPKTNVDGGHAPRAVAAGHVVLRAEEIPDCDFPVNEEDPNCELTEEDGEEVLVALRDVTAGEILTVGKAEGEEYEEFEYDPVSGKMTKVL